MNQFSEHHVKILLQSISLQIMEHPFFSYRRRLRTLSMIVVRLGRARGGGELQQDWCNEPVPSSTGHPLVYHVILCTKRMSIRMSKQKVNSISLFNIHLYYVEKKNLEQYFCSAKCL